MIWSFIGGFPINISFFEWNKWQKENKNQKFLIKTDLFWAKNEYVPIKNTSLDKKKGERNLKSWLL